MNAVTAEFEVRHHCQRQSVLKKKKNIYPRALNPTLNTVLWRTRACKVQAWPEMPVKKMELLELERASMHVFSVECITTWKESGCASSMTNFEFCRDRPHSMELHTLVLMYSCLNWAQWQHGRSGQKVDWWTGDRMRIICHIGQVQWRWFFSSSLLLPLLGEFSPYSEPPFKVRSAAGWHSRLCGDQRDASLQSLLRQ